MGLEFLLVSIVAITSNQVQTQFINKFTTVTACERAAQALHDGNSSVQQSKVFACVKHDPINTPCEERMAAAMREMDRQLQDPPGVMYIGPRAFFVQEEFIPLWNSAVKECVEGGK